MRRADIVTNMSKTKLYETSREVETLFLSAAEKGDKKAVLIALDHSTVFDVNCQDADGHSALVLAVVNGHFELVDILSSHSDVDLGDSLLRAVNLQYVPAVWNICKSMKQRNLLPEGLYCRSLNSDFHPDITPVVLAGHNNHYEILKILIDYGAKIDEPEDYKFFTEEFTMEHSVGRINVYRALCSEAVIGLTSPDPIKRAFDLSRKMRELSVRNFEFRFQFEDFSERCEAFGADLLSCIRNNQEQISVLTHAPEIWSKDSFRGDFQEPYKVKAAIECEQRKFVAHPLVQQRLAECWYHGLRGWRKHDAWKSLLYSLLMMASFPILSLCFIFGSKKYPGSLLRIPYVRFLCHVMSQFFFLIFLLVHFVDIRQFDVQNNNDVDETDDDTLITGKLTPSFLEFCIIIFVIAMTWQEVCQLHRRGRNCLVEDLQTSLFDIVTLCLYWGWLVIRLIAAMQVVMYKADDAHPTVPTALLNQTNNQTLTGFIAGVPPSMATLLESVGNDTDYDDYSSEESVFNEVIKDKVDLILDRQNEMEQRFYEKFAQIEQLIAVPATESESETVTDDNSDLDDVAKTRVRRAARSRGAGRRGGRTGPKAQGTSVIATLHATHPLLLAEGLLSLAKVFTFLRLVRITVVHLHIGPMQISFARMGGDILKFSAIFSLILLAFSVGMSELYHLYTDDYQSACDASDMSRCKIPYRNLQTSLSSLFWTLFGMTDLRSVEVTVAEHWMTELVGSFLFAVYHIVAIVALLNILIAMMSNTYTRIEEDADIQWKFSRSTFWISYYEENASLYPPFNLIPTMSDVRSFYVQASGLCKGKALDIMRRKKDEKINTMDKEYKVLMKELVQRYFFAVSPSDDPRSGFQTWMLQIREDVSNFKYETFEAFGYINKTVDSLKHTVEGTAEEADDKKKSESAAIGVGSPFLRCMAAALKSAEEARLPVRPDVFRNRRNGTLDRLRSLDIPFIDGEHGQHPHNQQPRDAAEDDCVEIIKANGLGSGTRV